ncbi:hypothetical protein HPB52_024173 [Rhipicephalus sanguineus]|uniref:SH3 domain-containing protein n=1 Tax=Rhipicephalus sanguineus TaxID=34632 RepID=A0A9D4PT09_RHISA|nr:hypothetical protein HPB52_024173 [Rhipicephalus sanguineus]
MAARLENEDSALVNTPGYRTGDRSGEAPPRRDEKDYEPVDVGAQVRATYKYTAEDVDELNFESGEIIRVIEYDDPEEQVSDGSSRLHLFLNVRIHCAGGRLADGHQRVDGRKGPFPSELHTANLRLEWDAL